MLLLPLAALARDDAVAAHGTPALPPGFSHFPHVRPDAPKGCTLRMAQSGTFDTLNPFTLRGRIVMGVWNWVYDPLLTTAPDESLVAYGHLAERFELDETTRRVRFTLRATARFQDGRPVTADDVAFTVTTLARYGRPFHRTLLERADPVVEGPLTISLALPDGEARRGVLRLGEVQILPRHDWEGRDFAALTMQLPIGSGPYRVTSVDPGRQVIFDRNRDWWARDLPTGRGRFNLDRIEVTWYRDRIAAFEALMAGREDWMQEADARRWAVGYDLPPVRDGRIRRVEQRHWYTTGMNGFAFNLRRPRFEDVRVREALSLLLDFEWANAALFHDSFRRTTSFFENSDLSASDAPDAAERELMADFASLFPKEAYERPWMPPRSDGSGRDRAMLERALALLGAAGWAPRDSDGRLANTATGEVFILSVLAQSNAQQALVGVWFRALRRIGVVPRFEVVDASTFTARTRAHDFDIVSRFTIPPDWPGAEQQNLWSSAAAARPGSGNLNGIADPALDGLLERLVAAPDRDTLRTTARVLDRALQWRSLVMPGYYDPVRRLAVADRFAWPAQPPRFSYGDDAWWCQAASPE
ncbi:extracellular solute-binding protein [Humitalea sp. 24SJ18S-53]|uniref:extracellular solute-binding protein n=1 Tax=Humitalea sp. 24SJ18S-53 TaxID=3422307 RepID=UPI003D679333